MLPVFGTQSLERPANWAFLLGGGCSVPPRRSLNNIVLFLESQICILCVHTETLSPFLPVTGHVGVLVLGYLFTCHLFWWPRKDLFETC